MAVLGHQCWESAGSLDGDITRSVGIISCISSDEWGRIEGTIIFQSRPAGVCRTWQPLRERLHRQTIKEQKTLQSDDSHGHEMPEGGAASTYSAPPSHHEPRPQGVVFPTVETTDTHVLRDRYRSSPGKMGSSSLGIRDSVQWVTEGCEPKI